MKGKYIMTKKEFLNKYVIAFKLKICYSFNLYPLKKFFTYIYSNTSFSYSENNSS